MTNKPEWEVEFEKNYSQKPEFYFEGFDQDGLAGNYDDVKAFIASQIQKAEKRGYLEGHQAAIRSIKIIDQATKELQ